MQKTKDFPLKKKVMNQDLGLNKEDRIMKTSRIILTLLAIVTVVSSCQKEELLYSGGSSVKMVPASINASAELTRTSLGSDLSVSWNAGDSISVFCTSDEGATYTHVKMTTTESGSSVTFNGSVPEGSKLVYALYPYDADNSIDPSSKKITTTIPTEQKAVAGGFDPAAAISVGIIASDGSVRMRNACGLMKITLGNSDATSVLVSGYNSEMLSGAFTINCSSDPFETTTWAITASPSVLLTNGGEAIPAGTYYVAIAPTSFTGIRLLFERVNGTKALRYSTESTSVSASSVRDFGTIDSGLNYKPTKTVSIRFRNEGYIDDITDNTQKYWPFKEASGTSTTNGERDKFTTIEGNYTLRASDTVSYYLHSQKGMQFKFAGAEAIQAFYSIAFPGYKLISVRMRSGGTNLKPSVSDNSGTLIKGGKSKSSSTNLVATTLYKWELSGTKDGESYRINLGASEKVITYALMQLEFEYISTAAAGTIAMVETAGTTSGSNSAVLGGNVIAVSMDASEIEACFKYRKAGDTAEAFTVVPAVMNPDFTFSAPVDGLEAGVAYEYYAEAGPIRGSKTSSSKAWFAPTPFTLEVKFHNLNDSKPAAYIPFSSPSSLKSSYKTPDSTNNSVTTLVLENTGIEMSAYGTYGIWRNNNSGFNFGTAIGCYIGLPLIEGLKLKEVTIKAGTPNSLGCPAICPIDSDVPISGGEASTKTVNVGDDVTWTLTGSVPNKQYRIYTTISQSAGLRYLTLKYE